MAQIRTALNLYYDDHTHYPTNTTPDCDNWNASAADFGATLGQDAATCYTEVLGTELTAGTRPYLGSVPKDPRNVDNLITTQPQLIYRYVSNPAGTEYAIVYQLEENPGVDQVMRGW